MWQQTGRLAFRQCFHLTQCAVHHIASRLRFVQCVQNCLRLLFNFGQHVAKLAKFCFDGTQNLPNFAGTFLERQGSETHLQRVQHGHQSCRAC